MFFNFDQALVMDFLLTLMRVSVVLFVLPIFSGQSVPAPIKAAMCMVIALAFYPALSFKEFPGFTAPGDGVGLAIVFLGEIMLGICLDLVVRTLFAAIQVGGGLIGVQMGFTMMNVVDPMSGHADAITAQFLNLIATLLFLILNGHHVLLQGVAASFGLIPPGGLLAGLAAGRPDLAHPILTITGQIFVLGVKVASPVLVSLFLLDFGLALVSRAAPQMNLMSVGFPFKIGVGFVFFGLILTLLARYIAAFLAGMPAVMESIFRASLTAAGS